LKKYFSVDVLINHKKCLITDKQINKYMEKALAALTTKELSYQHVELSVLISDDREIRMLNKQYRGKDYATDVLSFAQLEGEALAVCEAVSLGDIVISYDTAQRQADSQGVSLQQEISRLLIHGLLHLVGYDHEGVPEDVAQQMFNREDELLDVQGFLDI
jgi:probable rRNA maturation factor